MTAITFIGAVDMRTALTGCNSAIVATNTGTDDLAMIHCIGRDRYPRRWAYRVTGLAQVRTGNMGRALARGCSSIVATDTRLTHHRTVIKGDS